MFLVEFKVLIAGLVSLPWLWAWSYSAFIWPQEGLGNNIGDCSVFQRGHHEWPFHSFLCHLFFFLLFFLELKNYVNNVQTRTLHLSCFALWKCSDPLLSLSSFNSITRTVVGLKTTQARVCDSESLFIFNSKLSTYRVLRPFSSTWTMELWLRSLRRLLKLPLSSFGQIW